MDMTHLHPGDPVCIRSVRGTLQRILVAVEGELILACKSEEYELAMEQHRVFASPAGKPYPTQDT